MGAMKTGCLEILLVWAAAGLGLYSYFHPRFEPPGDIWGAAVGGLFISFCWGSLRNVVTTFFRRMLLKNAKFGMRPQDGKLCAAAGAIRPLGEPLLTPFQKQPCIAYGYEISNTQVVTTGSGSNRSTSHQKTVSMGGFAMCPCAVRTATGEVRILGFPFPNNFPEQNYPVPGVNEQILSYIANTKFEEMKGFAVGSMWSEIKNLLAEDDGSHRFDWKTPKLEAILDDPETSAMEQYIPANAEVCVIGTYSQAKGGLINDFSSGGLEVLSGKLETGVRALTMRMISGTIFGVLFGALGSAGAYGVLTAREFRSPEIMRLHEQRLLDGLKANDIQLVEKALQRGASPNGDNSNIEPFLAELRSKEIFDLLLRHGYEVNERHKSGYTPLLYAAERENTELVSWLLDAHADPNVPQANWGTTALEKAFDDRNQEMFRALFNRGARGIFVTEQTGTAIAPDGGEEMAAIRKYFQSYRSDDTATLRTLVDGWPEDFFESFSRGIYHGTRDCDPEFVRGLSNIEAATVVIRCAAGLGEDTWVFTLVRRGSEWRVRRDSWDEKGRWRAEQSTLLQ